MITQLDTEFIRYKSGLSPCPARILSALSVVWSITIHVAIPFSKHEICDHKSESCFAEYDYAELTFTPKSV